MTTLHADRYYAIRRRLLEAQKVAGRATLQEVVEALDGMYRAIRVVRMSLVQKAGEANPDVRIDDGDFSLLMTHIYDPKPDDPICKNCGAQVARGSTECPFCGWDESEPMTLSEWERLGKEFIRPLWDFKFAGPALANVENLRKANEAKKALAAENNQYPEIRPTTSKDLINGPTGEKRKRTVSGESRLTRQRESIAAYARKMAVRSIFPIPEETLNTCEQRDLRTILAAIPSFPKIRWKGMNILQMRELILRHQPQAPIGPDGWDEPPFGQLPVFIKRDLERRAD